MLKSNRCFDFFYDFDMPTNIFFSQNLLSRA